MSNENGRQPLNRRTEPSPRKAPRMEVIRLKGGEAFQCTILSASFHGYVVHWDARIRRSRPCFLDANVCEGCKEELPSKTLFYLNVWHGSKGCCFVELTEHCACQLKEILGDKISYRGVRVRLERTRAANGRLKVDVMEMSDDPSRCPAEQDPEDILRVLWDWKRS